MEYFLALFKRTEFLAHAYIIKLEDIMLRGNKPITKRQMLFPWGYLEQSHSECLRRKVLGDKGESCLMDKRFQFCKMERVSGDWSHNNMNTLNTTELNVLKVKMVSFICILPQILKMLSWPNSGNGYSGLTTPSKSLVYRL